MKSKLLISSTVPNNLKVRLHCSANSFLPLCCGMLKCNSVRQERTRGKQCTVEFCRPFTLGPVRAHYRIGHPSQAGRWMDGRAGGIDTSPNPSSNQGTAHRPSGTEGEVWTNKAHQAAIGQRYVDASGAGSLLACLLRFRLVISDLSREMHTALLHQMAFT